MTAKNELLERAQKIVDNHKRWGIVPIPLRGKDPSVNGKGWGQKTYSAAKFVFGKTLRNVGWLMGPASGWLCEIDLDTDRSEDISRAVALYSEAGCLIAGRAGQPRRIIFRVDGRPEDTWGTSSIPVSLPYDLANKTDKNGNPVPAGVDWRMGGYKIENGKQINAETQSCVIGIHEESGEELEFISGDPDDIPTIAWEAALALWDRLLVSLNVDLRGKTGWKEAAEHELKPRRSIEEYDWTDEGDVLGWRQRVDDCLSASQVCAKYGLPIEVPSSKHQPCPLCYEQRKPGEHAMLVSDDDFIMTCFHQHSCPARFFPRKAPSQWHSFSPLEVIGYYERFDFTFEEELELALEIAEEILGTGELKAEQIEGVMLPPDRKPQKPAAQPTAKDEDAILTSVAIPAEALQNWITAIINEMRGGEGEIDGATINIGKGNFLRIDDQWYEWNGKVQMPIKPDDIEPKIERLARTIPVSRSYIKRDVLAPPVAGMNPTQAHLAHVLQSGVLTPPSQTLLTKADRRSNHNIITGEQRLKWQGAADGYFRVSAEGELEFEAGSREWVFPRSLPYDAPKTIRSDKEILAAEGFPFADAMMLWFPGPVVRLRAWQWLGSMIYGHPVQRKLALPHGVGGSGKTTFVDSCASMVGRQHSVTLELANFNDANFIISQVSGKSLVHINDVPADSEAGGHQASKAIAELKKEVFARAKSWLGAQETTGRGPYQKYQDHKTEFQMAFTTNEIPTIGGSSENESLKRRLLLLPMTSVIPAGKTEREDYWRELTEESGDMALIAELAVSAYCNLRRSVSGREEYATTDELDDMTDSILQHDFADILEHLDEADAETAGASESAVPLAAVVLFWQKLNGEKMDYKAVHTARVKQMKDIIVANLPYASAKKRMWKPAGHKMIVLEGVFLEPAEHYMWDWLDEIEEKLGYSIDSRKE